MTGKILVVDDETVLLETIAYNLEQAGYQVTTAADGLSGVDAARQDPPDLIILDIMLPGIDGLEACRRIRRENATRSTPILMLTAKGDEIDKVVGLEVGADDYVTKPFGRQELLARVRALLRRAHYSTEQQPATPAPVQVSKTEEEKYQVATQRNLIAGPLTINVAGRQIFYQGQEIELQSKQFDLLTYMVRNRGTVLTRDQLLQHVWGYDYVGDTRTVDVHIRWLREKIEEDPSNPRLLQTVRGVGYVFRV